MDEESYAYLHFYVCLLWFLLYAFYKVLPCITINMMLWDKEWVSIICNPSNHDTGNMPLWTLTGWMEV
jgi:hypothetical protein